MDQIPILEIQENRDSVRQAAPNPNHWYPLSWSTDLKPGIIRDVCFWQQNIALFRTQSGMLQALENACLHKGVELHKGTIEGERVVCPYHGWEFDGEGNCLHIPYLPEGQVCPKARIRSYPVREACGIVWVFPGDPQLADATPLPEVPEYGGNDWFVVRIPGHFHAHFSTCNENTMDVFHGHLHNNLQGWFDPVLTRLERDDQSVLAQYQVSYKGYLAVLLGLAKSAHEVYHRHVDIEYRYPHYKNSMGDSSSLYLMRLPVGPQETRSFSLMFLKIGLPGWLWKPLQGVLAPVLWHLLLKRFLDQDKEMIESEQHSQNHEPNSNRVEINPAISALRRVIIRQHKAAISDANSAPDLPESESAKSGPTESLAVSL